MKKREWMNWKNMMIVLIIVFIVAASVGTVIFMSARRQYQIVNAPSFDTEDSIQKHDDLDLTGADKIEEGIVVSLSDEVPEGFDAIKFVKQGYELKTFMAIESFDSASDLPVGPTVQYAFCYLFSGDRCLVDYQPSAMTYRQASEDQIRDQIIALFGACPLDLKASNLYSSGNQYFEMWQPDYSRHIYATGTVSKTGEETYRIKVSYFKDADRSLVQDTAEIVVKETENGSFYIASMA